MYRERETERNPNRVNWGHGTPWSIEEISCWNSMG